MPVAWTYLQKSHPPSDGNLMKPADNSVLRAPAEQVHAEELARLINRIKDGKFQEAKATPDAVKGLQRALEVVVIGKRDVEKLCKQVTGTVGATSLDFHAARDEIGRRLARLRDAGPG